MGRWYMLSCQDTFKWINVRKVTLKNDRGGKDTVDSMGCL